MTMHDSRRIEALLDSELVLAEQLATTLESERKALTGTSPDAVRELAAAKVDLLVRLEEVERGRRELCQGRDMTQFDGLAARWNSLMALMSRCRTANEVNGYIINVRRHQVQQLLDVVRGTKSLTYGPAGKTFPRALRELARA
jgi:flagellar biosynthesis/type III secretory pathway chaperone